LGQGADTTIRLTAFQGSGQGTDENLRRSVEAGFNHHLNPSGSGHFAAPWRRDRFRGLLFYQSLHENPEADD